MFLRKRFLFYQHSSGVPWLWKIQVDHVKLLVNIFLSLL